MNFWDAALGDPAANLAADEALLHNCEAGGGEVLRVWEPADYFVVLGFANVAAREANLEACRRARVPVLRRCSGGGAVLQGPGCLNYALILRIDDSSEAQSIPSTNLYIMERQRAALSSALSQPVTVRGVSDLCLGGLKFSGNAQRRLRHALIFHGTFLLNFDFERMEEFLAMPSRQPEYRHERSHRDFLANIPAPAALIKETLRVAWGANQNLREIPDAQRLVREKYSRDEWNLKY
jgi:lipoate-protein ligase A